MVKSNKSEVVETTDPEISAENSSDEIGTGEIDQARASEKSSPENESGKKLPDFSKPQLAEPPEETQSHNPRNRTQADESGVVAGKPHGSSEKKVVVQIAHYQKCKIGPRWYEFHPGKQYRVPENVKEILKRKKALAVV